MAVGKGKISRSGHGGEPDTASWQAHWYQFPLLNWIGASFASAGCPSDVGFDIGWMTEFDPLWQDEELGIILNPEAVLFGNPIAQAACAADCVAATVGTALDPLFWCNGCQGGLYPPTGRVRARGGQIQSSLLVAGRLMAKLHRQLTAWGTSGPAAIASCAQYPMPIIQKSQYRTQMASARAYANGHAWVRTSGKVVGVLRKRAHCAGARELFLCHMAQGELLCALVSHS